MPQIYHTLNIEFFDLDSSKPTWETNLRIVLFLWLMTIGGLLLNAIFLYLKADWGHQKIDLVWWWLIEDNRSGTVELDCFPLYHPTLDLCDTLCLEIDCLEFGRRLVGDLAVSMTQKLQAWQTGSSLITLKQPTEAHIISFDQRSCYIACEWHLFPPEGQQPLLISTVSILRALLFLRKDHMVSQT